MQNPNIPQFISADIRVGTIFKPTLATIYESPDETNELMPAPVPVSTNEEPNK